MKICTGCNRELPFSEFWKRKSAPDGYEWKCRGCAKKVVEKNFASKPHVEPPPKGFKRCPRCTQIRPFECFAWNAKAKDHRQTQCKACKREQYLAKGHSRVTERTKANRTAIQKFVDEYKMAAGCMVCNYKRCPAALDPHHRDPGEKEFSIGSAKARNVSLEKLRIELEKCDILCANCHRELHYLGGRNDESS
jgi:hypothetical protein